jgi:hypothetical protein
MASPLWLEQLRFNRNRRQTARFRHKTQPRALPRFEVLEDRTLPSAYVVTTTADSGPGCLRDAISQINADTSHTLYTSPSDPTRDEIDFNIAGLSASTPGTISLGGSELLLTNSVIINGSGERVLAVSGNGLSCVFEVSASATAAISGLTVENGYVSGGIANGGIANLGNLTVTDCTISRNLSTGITNYGTMTVSGCTIADNTGEGIVNGGMMTVTGCTLTSTLTTNNGAGIENGGTMTVTGCILAGNASAEIDNAGNFAAMTVTGCTLSGQRGSGISNRFGTMAVSNCTVFDTQVGIRNDFGTMTVTGCTLTGNVGGVLTHFSEGAGAAIFNRAGTITVSGCTMAGNGASAGGAIYNQSDLGGNNSVIVGSMTVSSCILSGNSGLGGIFNDGYQRLSQRDDDRRRLHRVRQLRGRHRQQRDDDGQQLHPFRQFGGAGGRHRQ